MLKKLIDWITYQSVEKKSLQFLRDHPGLKQGRERIRYLLYEAPFGLSKTLSEENRNVIFKNLIQEGIEIYQSNDPLFENRKLLVPSVLDMSYYGVLILDPDKDSNQYSSHPAISGELHKHLIRLVGIDKELNELVWEYSIQEPYNYEDLYSIFLIRHWRAHVRAEFFQTLRIDFNDIRVDGKDWYRPFITAMYVWYEDTFRTKLGLTSLAEKEFGDLGALKNSLFVNILLENKKNPLYEFENEMKKSHNSNNNDTCST